MSSRSWPRPAWTDPAWIGAEGAWPPVGLDEVVLRGWAGRAHDDPVVCDDVATWTLPDLVAAVRAADASLAECGLGPGDVLAIQSTNRVEVVSFALAAWRRRAVVALLAPRGGEAALAHALDLVAADVVVAEEGLSPASTAEVIVLPADDRLGGAPVVEPPPPGAAPTPLDPAVVLFTGGSTGAPKAVVHGHAGLAGKATTMARVHGLGAGDTVLMPAPLSHMSGLLNGILVPAAAGMRVVLMSRWSADRAVALVERHGVTFMVGPPTFFTGLRAAADRAGRPGALDSLRLLSVGGAEVGADVVTALRSSLGAEVKRSYGSTEAPTVTTSHAGDPADRAAHSDGRATGPTTEVTVVDPATGEVLADGTVGEIRVRGPEVMLGRLGAADEAVDAAGWYRTGDLGRLDRGWLTVVGRLDHRIIRGGENIDPIEVESLLRQHPDVADVAVVAEPHDHLGQRAAAFVVTAAATGPDLEAVRDWFRDRGASPLATPERIVVVDELPLLPNGKVDRAGLAARAAEQARAEGLAASD